MAIRRGQADTTADGDARFEDGAPVRLRLRAETPEDLAIVSALLQDSVAEVGAVAWLPRRRRLAALVSRVRWEAAPPPGQTETRPVERVRTLVGIEGALRVRATGLDPRDRDQIVSILALQFSPGPEGAGVLTLVLAGDGAVEVEVEMLEVTLTDVSDPYPASAGRLPTHPEA